jgi:mannose-6-phosphate isomerase
LPASIDLTMSLREPLRFVPHCHERIWGGKRLTPFLRGARAATQPIGEVWTLVDRPGESSRVDGGRLEGHSLGELCRSEGPALLGRARPQSTGFPLLVKLLDTGERLSVQVHPDARTAARLSHGAQGKTECWYVLSAREGACLHLGLRPGVGPERIRASAGTEALVDLLQEWPVETGDFVFVPPGTVHSIGAGITLVEIQESSDTTYRLYDWGRVGPGGRPRETHLEQALESIDYRGTPSGPVQPRWRETSQGMRVAELVDCAAFVVSLLEINGRAERTTHERPLVYVVLAGRGSMRVEGCDGEHSLEAWETWLLPADAALHHIAAKDSALRLLVVEARGEGN